MAVTRTDIVTIGYNQPEMETDAIRAVLEHTPHGQYGLRYAVNEKGRGIGSFLNELIAGCTDAEFICTLAPDTLVGRNWFTQLHLAMATIGDGVVVPLSNETIPEAKIAVSYDKHPRQIDVDTMADACGENTNVVRNIPMATSMCSLFRRNTWKTLGGFDETFGLFCEDREFFWRVKTQLGLPLVCATRAFVHHYGGACIRRAATEEGLNPSAGNAAGMALMRSKGARYSG